MIIGIDDSGNFETDSMSLYASVFIRPKRYEQIKRKFLAWEESLPDTVKENGEVKGRLLNEAQLLDFADIILTNNGHGAIKNQVFGIEINSSNTNHLIIQQERNVVQLREQVKEVYRSKGKEYNRIASFYEQMADWLASKSLKTLYKMELLGISIVKSINLAIVTSTLRGFDKELGKLQINIDQGITGRASVENYWKDIMRTTFWHITYYIEPILHIVEWRPNHPYVVRFMKHPKSTDAMTMFTEEIRNVFSFHDSRDRFEIRIADIIANAYFRKYVLNEDLDRPIEIISKQRVQFGSPYIRVSLGGKAVENPVNPYEDGVNGVTAKDLDDLYG